MRKASLTFLGIFLVHTLMAQSPNSTPWRYRAGVNLNGLRVRTLELSGQALKKGKLIYNLNLGYTYQSPRNGAQTTAQKNRDSIKADIKTSGFFIKPGVQANLFTIADKFTKADIFVGAGVCQTWYNRNSSVLFLKESGSKEKTGEYKGSVTAPYVSVGTNMRLLYSVYLDLGLQYSLGKAQSSDKLLPARYDWLPGLGGNFRNGNKASLLFVARWEFDQK